MIAAAETVDVKALHGIENVAPAGTRTADCGAGGAGGARYAAEGTSAAAGAIRLTTPSGTGNHHDDDRETNDQQAAHQSFSHRFHLLCGFDVFVRWT